MELREVILDTWRRKDAEEASRSPGCFRVLRIGIAIDDFGTRYSNLAYVRRFPAHRIKLDRMSVSELDSQSISRAIVKAIGGNMIATISAR
jgi:EAL domain-containing protein (putative c-di-GMP-specific phosphodiesterase class I)